MALCLLFSGHILLNGPIDKAVGGLTASSGVLLDYGSGADDRNCLGRVKNKPSGIAGGLFFLVWNNNPAAGCGKV